MRDTSFQQLGSDGSLINTYPKLRGEINQVLMQKEGGLIQWGMPSSDLILKGARVFQTDNTMVAPYNETNNSLPYILRFNSVRHDTGNLFNPQQPDRFTITNPGLYLVFGHITSGNVSNSYERVGFITKNGSAQIAGDAKLGGSSWSTSLITIAKLNAEDYVQLSYFRRDPTQSDILFGGSSEAYYHSQEFGINLLANIEV